MVIVRLSFDIETCRLTNEVNKQYHIKYSIIYDIQFPHRQYQKIQEISLNCYQKIQENIL